MIVKSLTWKTRGFDRLVDYIGKERRDEDETFRLLHNLRPSRNLTGIAGQFWANDAYRKERVNGVVCYHEILSFLSGEDVPLDVAEDLAREYLELRAPNALAYAEPHFDKGHLHIHIIISGTEFESAKTLRLDNEQFMHVRREIERYQKEHYPELKSLVYQDRQRERIEELEAIQEATALRDRAHEEPAFQEEPPLQEEEAEAARIRELEEIQEEQRRRGEQERGLE